VNDRQRDLFLYQWSRRRAPGASRIAQRGAVIGALGGLAFAAILLQDGAHTPGVDADDFAGQVGSALTLLGLSIPAFALIGWTGARRVWTSNETIYRAMVESGAQVPDRKPVLTLADRGPLLAVVITVAVIAAFIAYLIWAASTGNL
jgi:hypothetical protein